MGTHRRQQFIVGSLNVVDAESEWSKPTHIVNPEGTGLRVRRYSVLTRTVEPLAPGARISGGEGSSGRERAIRSLPTT